VNTHLFSAFLLITVVLFLTPGPIVTLIIATAARSGTRAALVTVAGVSTGNAVLLALLALGLGWILPQFIDPALPVGHQLLVMCICSVTLGSILDCGWAVAAGYGRSVFVKPQHNRLLGRLSALALIGGGVWLSLARRPG
jgi:threonine/homoserine/homoserine lactone efflux protein